MHNDINLDKTYQILLIILAFLMPVTIFGANTIIVFIVLLWLFSGGYKEKFHTIKKSKVMLASIVFFGMHVLGLFWTEDLNWGLHIVRKMWYFGLLFPIFFTIVKEKFVKYYIFSFLLAITLTEIISYIVWFEFIIEFGHANPYDPTPFMSHISHNPILAFAIYIVCHELFFNKSLSKLKFYWYSFLALTMTFNMFITGGRAGQVMFFVMVAILIFQFFDRQRVKALFSIVVFIPLVFFTAYKTSPLFHDRVVLGVNSIIEYSQNTNYKSSIGYRLIFAENSWELIKKNSIFGVGTGDFPEEYKKINSLNTPSLPNITNPHNMYILVLSQLGLLGLFSMLTMVYYQIQLSFKENNRFYKDVGITLPILFLVIMWSDSYLLGHYTTLVYIFFSSFLYKRFD